MAKIVSEVNDMIGWVGYNGIPSGTPDTSWAIGLVNITPHAEVVGFP
jgi:hypothetical protein